MTNSISEIRDTEMMFVIGSNTSEAHPIIAMEMKRAVRNGSRLIVADPRGIDLVRSPHIKAEHHLQLRPGSNVALLNSLAHVIVTENLVSEAFVAERCEAEPFEQWRAFVSEQRNSPEAMQELTGVPAAEVRAAARLYATGGNAAIYYGLGVTEHSQGSSTVMAIANLAMATGNIGRPGVGVNPLRGQNNVQGSCDMGSFPHELPGYRHVSDPVARPQFEQAWGVTLLDEPGLRIPNMLAAAHAGTFKGLYIQGEDPAQSDPDTQHVTGALMAMECVVVQDLFLNETAAFAHVFLPGTSFLEKDGTFTNAERRINRVRPVKAPLQGTYLLFGHEPLLIEESCDAIRRAALAQGFDERLRALVGLEFGHLRPRLHAREAEQPDHHDGDRHEDLDEGEAPFRDRKSTRLNSSHMSESRMPSSA